MENQKPDWAKGEGVKKNCLKCGREFTDWTKKQRWIHCLGCWQMDKDKYPPGEEPFSIKVRRTHAKNMPLDHRVCRHCDGNGCLDCSGTGIADLPPEKELFLGRH